MTKAIENSPFSLIKLHETVLLSPARLERVDWTDKLLNWITKYKMIVVALTLVGATAPCGNAPTRQGIQEAKVDSKHTMTNTCRPSLCLYIERGDLTPKQSNPKTMCATVATVTVAHHSNSRLL
jgi:hypothetical protein